MKNRASGRTSRHPYLTMVAFDNRLTDRETHSHPACFGREHWFKNATEIGHTNSTPVSEIETRTVLCPDSDLMTSTRGSAAETIASTAFIIRFKITCCNWTSFPNTGGSCSLRFT